MQLAEVSQNTEETKQQQQHMLPPILDCQQKRAEPERPQGPEGERNSGPRITVDQEMPMERKYTIEQYSQCNGR